MIRISVEDYCHKCLEFTPDMIDPTRTFSIDGEEVFQTDTLIKCKHRKRCANIVRYLEQQLKGGSTNG